MVNNQFSREASFFGQRFRSSQQRQKIWLEQCGDSPTFFKSLWLTIRMEFPILKWSQPYAQVTMQL
ncbi:hypothetical protein MAAFP003_3201 [Mycobacterium ahvazicum]|uniref:Uncharacterized protein n=1 Tax=Mycobacterium ahvazicum TaxID=1964395 RepID=A0A2K4YCL1_9MYCO|nr:hypothetical protein MAAFP003_3201 [Mycobacterium ahvazicum]